MKIQRSVKRLVSKNVFNFRPQAVKFLFKVSYRSMLYISIYVRIQFLVYVNPILQYDQSLLVQCYVRMILSI
jgi:hypothetical protein